METPIIQFGLETEIGISRDSEEELDVVAESIALVRSAMEPGVRMRWDYESEDPHADSRGFRVQELRQDFDEANYFAQDAQRELTFSEIKSDLVLANGAHAKVGTSLTAAGKQPNGRVTWDPGIPTPEGGGIR